MYNLLIVTPEETLYHGDVSYAIFPGSEGGFEILTNHMPLMTQVKEGQVRILENEADDDEIKVDIAGGFLEFSNNTCVLLADATVKE